MNGNVENLEQLQQAIVAAHDDLETLKRRAHQCGLTSLYCRTQYSGYYQNYPEIICSTCEDETCRFNILVCS